MLGPIWIGKQVRYNHLEPVVKQPKGDSGSRTCASPFNGRRHLVNARIGQGRTLPLSSLVNVCFEGKEAKQNPVNPLRVDVERDRIPRGSSVRLHWPYRKDLYQQVFK